MAEARTFGQAAQDARLATRVTMRAVAGALSFTASYISDIERGNRNPPKPEVARKWAEVIGADPDEFARLATPPVLRDVDELREIARGLAVQNPWRLAPDGVMACCCCGGVMASGHRSGCIWLRALRIKQRDDDEAQRA